MRIVTDLFMIPKLLVAEGNYYLITFAKKVISKPSSPLTELVYYYSARRARSIFMMHVKLNPITHGGGLFGLDHQIVDHNSKTALSSTSKLGDFLVLSIRHILAEFKRNRFPRGVAAVVFEMKRLEKLNIRSFLFRLKTMQMQKGV